MLVLMDTGILLRLANSSDPFHPTVVQAIPLLVSAGHSLCTAPQNIVEFWSAFTRPAKSRGGYGGSLQDAEIWRRHFENVFPFLPDSARMHPIWSNLVNQFSVVGRNVHDARLVAFMHAYAIDHLLTLNPSDFAAYTFLTVLTPSDVITQQLP